VTGVFICANVEIKHISCEGGDDWHKAGPSYEEEWIGYIRTMKFIQTKKSPAVAGLSF
jgi:hypothetical protein